MKKYTAVLDFGTSKILVLLGEQNNSSLKVALTSAGMARYNGFMNGQWTTPEQVTDAIASAIEKAEKKANVKIKDVYVGVPGEFTRIYIGKGQVSLQGADPKVTSEDVDKVQLRATEELKGTSGVIIHRSPAWFRVDKGNETLEPVGVKGKELEGMISFVLGDQFFINDVTDRLRKLNINVRGFYSNSVGEALQLVPFAERDNVAVLVDVGFLSTDVMILEGDAVIWEKVIEMGGAHITADLSYGLEQPFELCETLKRGFAFNSPKTGEVEVEMEAAPGEERKTVKLSAEMVHTIIEARTDEILDAVVEAVKKSGFKLNDYSQWYFTGGGLITMKDAKSYISAKLGHNVREGETKTVRLKPAHVYTSGSGLIELIFNIIEMEEEDQGLLDKIKSFFGK